MRARAAVERSRAARAAGLSVRYLARADRDPGPTRSLFREMAELHRGAERRHLVSAGLHDLHADQIERWLLTGLTADSPEPVFMDAVAAVLRIPWAAVVVPGLESVSAIAAVSDRVARQACDIETVMGEGPLLASAAEGVTIAVAGRDLWRRWPRYGPAVVELGVHSVVATPLGAPGGHLGMLGAYSQDAGPPAGLVGQSEWLAAVLAGVLVDEERTEGAATTIEVLRIAGAGDTWTALYQAVGMVSVHCRCTLEQARDLIAARAFADGRPLSEIALAIVQGNLRLC
ncbi:MAG: hypothetical protein ACYCO9_07790 [Streptosporangiaceae bacterium]